MSNGLKFPGRNVVTLCPAALMLVIQQALNERTYGNEKEPIYVLDVTTRQDGGTTLFDLEVTTDKQSATVDA